MGATARLATAPPRLSWAGGPHSHKPGARQEAIMPIKLLTPEEQEEAYKVFRIREKAFRRLFEQEQRGKAQIARRKGDKVKRDKAGPLPELVKAAWRASGLFGAACFPGGKLHPTLRALLREADVGAEHVGDKY